MKLIVGLGNTGKKYEGTRHNIGFEAVEALAHKLNATQFKEEKKFKAEIAKAGIGDETIIFAKPTTFMNLSGDAVILIKSYFEIDNEDIYVVFDDVDLPFGKIRFKSEGSAGTHNGMKSVIAHIGSAFPRIKIGIESRSKELKEKMDLSSFVLSRFSKEEEGKLTEIIESSIDLILEKINN